MWQPWLWLPRGFVVGPGKGHEGLAWVCSSYPSCSLGPHPHWEAPPHGFQTFGSTSDFI